MTKRKYVLAEEGCHYPCSKRETSDGNGYWREFNSNGKNTRMSRERMIGDCYLSKERLGSLEQEGRIHAGSKKYKQLY